MPKKSHEAEVAEAEVTKEDVAKDEVVDTSASDPSQEPEIAPAVPDPSVADPMLVEPAVVANPHWTENLWYRESHFECSLCSFDTMSKDDLLAHLDAKHPFLSDGSRKSSYLKYDRFDEVIPGSETTTPPPTLTANEPGFTENTWNGQTHFDCRLCTFDSLDRSEMDAHLDASHPVLASGDRKSAYLKYDRWDNLVQEGS